MIEYIQKAVQKSAVQYFHKCSQALRYRRSKNNNRRTIMHTYTPSAPSIHPPHLDDPSLDSPHPGPLDASPSSKGSEVPLQTGVPHPPITVDEYLPSLKPHLISFAKRSCSPPLPADPETAASSSRLCCQKPDSENFPLWREILQSYRNIQLPDYFPHHTMSKPPSSILVSSE